MPVRMPSSEGKGFAGFNEAPGFEMLTAKASDNHRWYYASRMTPEEVIMIKCYDSRTSDVTLARRALHSAFVDPEPAGETVSRESIECRCLVF